MTKRILWGALAVASLPLVAEIILPPQGGGGGSIVGGSITGAYSFNGPFSSVNVTNIYLSAVLSNQVVTGISPGATNAGFYVGSSIGRGTNTGLINPTNFLAYIAGGIQSTGIAISARGTNSVDLQTLRANAWEYNNGDYSGILSGRANMIGTNYQGSVIAGGENNSITNYVSGAGWDAIAGGTYNVIDHGEWSFIGGGFLNFIDTPTGSSIVGGLSNTNSGSYNFIGGGIGNRLRAFRSATMVGGETNQQGGDWSFIGGGAGNVIGDITAAGDFGNFASIPGGVMNNVQGYYSAALGSWLSVPGDSNIVIGFGTSNVLVATTGAVVNVPFLLPKVPTNALLYLGVGGVVRTSIIGSGLTFSGGTLTATGGAGGATNSGLPNVISNIVVSTTNNLLLDFAAANEFKLSLLTNFFFTFTNVTSITNWEGFLGHVYVQQDTNGGRILNGYAVAGGILQTNALMQPDTNANAFQIMEVRTGFFPTNLAAAWVMGDINAITNENSPALQVDNGILSFTPGPLSNIVASGVTPLPGGSSAAVQFNEDGAFAGTNRFEYDRTNEYIRLTGGGAQSGVLRIYPNKIFLEGNGTLYLGNGSHTNWAIDASGHWVPHAGNVQDLGGPTLPVRTNWNMYGVFSNGIQINTNASVGRLLTSDASGNGRWSSSITNLQSVGSDLLTMLIPTNSATSNLTVNFSVTNQVEIWFTNNLTFTNWAGFTDANASTWTAILRPQLINRGVNWGNLGLANHGYGVAIGTNANNLLWTTLTNGQVYALSIARVRTNLFPTLTLWQ